MKNITAATILAAALLASGCSHWENWRDRGQRKRYVTNSYPDNPVPGLKTVGVVVLDASYRYPVDTLELTSALHTQLQQVIGLQVAPDAAVLQAVQTGGYALPMDGMKLAGDLGLDGLFIAIVTQYDPYGELLLGLGLTLFTDVAPSLDRVDMDGMIQGGRDLPLPEGPGAKPVTAVFAVYDASQQNVRQRVEWFAEGQTAADVGMSWERYLRTTPSYMKFVSYEIVWKLFTTLQHDVGLRTDSSNVPDLPGGGFSRRYPPP